MSEAAANTETQDILIDDVLPNAPSAIWKALASGELINRWLMPQIGFEPVAGNTFSFQTPPTDDWDGVIHCQILEIIPNERLSYSWKSGMQTAAGYVPRLDTIVTWTLAKHDAGTRLRLVHSGFVLPKNAAVFKNVNAGWSKIIPKMIAIAADLQ
ncbi:MAG: SRPBCC family protein [Rhizobiaceae bacterium]